MIFLSRDSPKHRLISIVASLVATVRTTSRSFITGAGFMKCRPITFSGREVAMAISMTERHEVLVARTVCSGHTLSISANRRFFRSMFSLEASITRSQ